MDYSTGAADEDFKEDSSVDDFFEALKFFSPPLDVAARLHRINQRIGDYLVDEELEGLSAPEETLQEQDISPSVVGNIRRQLASILFSESADEVPGETAESELSESEILSFFQKVIAERIYDRLSLLALSPHAKQKGSFSLGEELTGGIAEDIGLGFCLEGEKENHLCKEGWNALIDLACAFQEWLIKDRYGCFVAEWGMVRVVGMDPIQEVIDSQPVVWLEADAEELKDKQKELETVEVSG